MILVHGRFLNCNFNFIFIHALYSNLTKQQFLSVIEKNNKSRTTAVYKITVDGK